MKPAARPTTAIQETTRRLKMEVWHHKNEIGKLEMMIERLTELQAADDKEAEAEDKERAAALARIDAAHKPAAKKAPGKTKNRDNSRLSPTARKRIAAAQKKRWAEHRKKQAAAESTAKAANAKPAHPAKPNFKPNFAERMRNAVSADEGREIIGDLEQAIWKLQRSIGMKPTVGEVEPGHHRGFSIVSASEWAKALSEAKDRNPIIADRIGHLVRNGRVAHGAPWEKLRKAEEQRLTDLGQQQRPLTAVGGAS